MKVRIYIRAQNDHARGKWFDMEDYQNASQLLDDIVDTVTGGNSPLGIYEAVDYEGITATLAERLGYNVWGDYAKLVKKFKSKNGSDHAPAYIAWANHPDNYYRATDGRAFWKEYASTGTWEDFVADVISDEIMDEIPAHLHKYIAVDRAKFESDLKERYYMIDRYIFRHI